MACLRVRISHFGFRILPVEALQQDAADFEQQRVQDREVAAVEHEIELDTATKAHARKEKELDLDSFLAGKMKELELAKKIRDDALEARYAKGMQDIDLERARLHVLEH